MRSLITCVACGSIGPSIPDESAETASLASSDGIDSMSSMWADSDEFGDGEEHESLPVSSWANSKSGTSYVYDKLGESNIRLLSIQPGQFNDEIYCQLVQESLSNLPVYDAISYTWADDSGDRQKNKTIRLGSELFKVTTSYQLALRRARLHRKLTVWIDAMCINQNDKNERTH